MKPSLERKVVELIRALDDSFSLNGQAANLRGLAAHQKALRAVRDRIDTQEGVTTRRLTALRGGFAKAPRVR